MLDFSLFPKYTFTFAFFSCTSQSDLYVLSAGRRILAVSFFVVSSSWLHPHHQPVSPLVPVTFFNLLLFTILVIVKVHRAYLIGSAPLLASVFSTECWFINVLCCVVYVWIL